MNEKHKNPTNVPILKKFHRVGHAQLAFENASTHLFSSRYQNNLRMLMIPFGLSGRAWTARR